MKVAVINFSGNVGKTTLARHLLAPRIGGGCEVVSIESINADEAQTEALRGKQFAQLQEYLHTVDHLVVDIGASNVEDLLALMRRYKGSHEDYDAFVVPVVPALKQQQDTIATLVELAKLGIEPQRLRLVFNQLGDDETIEQAFATVLGFLDQHAVATASTAAVLGTNEVYQRVKLQDRSIAELAADEADYKALIAKAGSTEEKVDLADKLAVKRLAQGVVPDLDACFAALALE